jgi:uncharacterized phiE125 gp8 family phage protein
MSYYMSSKVNVDIITLNEMKLYLRIDDTTEDALITALIKACVLMAEKIMNKDLLTTTWINYRDDDIEDYTDLTLRKGQFQSLVSIEYLEDGVYNTVGSDDYIIQDYGVYGKIWELDVDATLDEHPEALKITFKTGYGDTASDIPEDIKTAIKAHVAYMYENRGDCDIDMTCDSVLHNFLPISSKLIYYSNRIVDITI